MDERNAEVERIIRETNLYRVLGVSIQDCDNPDALKSALRKREKLVHPERCDHPGAVEALARLRHAYDVLSDPEQRDKYDQFGEEIPEPPPQPNPEPRQQRPRPRQQEEQSWCSGMCMYFFWLIIILAAPNILQTLMGMWSNRVSRSSMKGILSFQRATSCAERKSAKYGVRYYVPTWFLHPQTDSFLRNMDGVADVLYEEELDIDCELEKNQLGREGTKCAKRKKLLGR